MIRIRLPRLSAAVLPAALAALAAGPALAHPGHPGHEDLGAWAGFVHPFTGLDHMLAMTAVGLWAALRGGRALLIWPATFVAAMAIGFQFGGLSSYLLEGGVLASVVLLGALTAVDHRGGRPIGLGIVAAAGALHGMAHAADVGPTAPTFAIGMLAATTMLHGAGLGLGAGLQSLRRGDVIRWLGAATAATGVLLAVAG